MIELHDLDSMDEDAIRGAPIQPLAGYLHFLPDGSWMANRISTSCVREGSDSLRGLEAGLWITNLSWEQTSALNSGMRHIKLRSDGWLKLSCSQILAMAGMDDASAPAITTFLASVVHRIHDLSLGLARRMNPDPRFQSKVRASILTKPSLASALHVLHGNEIQNGRPSEKRIASIFKDTYQLGLFPQRRKTTAEGQLSLSFRFPALSHALQVTRDPIPDLSPWQVGIRKRDISADAFISGAREIGRPVIFRAGHMLNEVQTPLVDALMGANRASSTYRSLFLSEEIDLLLPRSDILVEAVMVGGGWRMSSTRAILEAMVQVCGGVQAASHSLSAQILAENILASPLRIPPGESDVQSAEGIWLTARDRCRMFPAAEAFESFGATLVSGNSGCVTIQCPGDPELLSGVLDAAWHQGMLLPIGMIRPLESIGVVIPRERHDFGGNHVDYSVCMIAQTARRKALLSLDDVMDAPETERSERFRAKLA